MREPPDPVGAFLAERRVATLTTIRPDGSPHVVAVSPRVVTPPCAR